MPSPKHTLSQAVGSIEAAQISVEPLDSKFVTAVVAAMPKLPEIKEEATRLSSGLERLLMRHHDDSRLIVSTSAALGEASEHELPAFVQKLSRFTKHMEAPVAAHSVKTMKMANLVSTLPEILEIEHIDSIQALSRLPEGSVTKGHKKGEIQVGEAVIRIARADPGEIAAAVKKVREAGAAIRKIEKAARVAQTIDTRELQEARAQLDDEDLETDALDDVEGELEEPQDNLKPQLSDAASALTKVLGSLSRNNSHPELSHVLSEARKLLVLTMREDEYVPDLSESSGQDSTGDFH